MKIAFLYFNEKNQPIRPGADSEAAYYLYCVEMALQAPAQQSAQIFLKYISDKQNDKGTEAKYPNVYALGQDKEIRRFLSTLPQDALLNFICVVGVGVIPNLVKAVDRNRKEYFSLNDLFSKHVDVNDDDAKDLKDSKKSGETNALSASKEAETNAAHDVKEVKDKSEAKNTREIRDTREARVLPTVTLPPKTVAGAGTPPEANVRDYEGGGSTAIVPSSCHGWPHSPAVRKEIEAAGFLFRPLMIKKDRCVCDTCGAEMAGWRQWHYPWLFHNWPRHNINFGPPRMIEAVRRILMTEAVTDGFTNSEINSDLEVFTIISDYLLDEDDTRLLNEQPVNEQANENENKLAQDKATQDKLNQQKIVQDKVKSHQATIDYYINSFVLTCQFSQENPQKRISSISNMLVNRDYMLSMYTTYTICESFAEFQKYPLVKYAHVYLQSNILSRLPCDLTGFRFAIQKILFTENLEDHMHGKPYYDASVVNISNQYLPDDNDNLPGSSQPSSNGSDSKQVAETRIVLSAQNQRKSSGDYYIKNFLLYFQFTQQRKEPERRLSSIKDLLSPDGSEYQMPLYPVEYVEASFKDKDSASIAWLYAKAYNNAKDKSKAANKVEISPPTTFACVPT